MDPLDHRPGTPGQPTRDRIAVTNGAATHTRGSPGALSAGNACFRVSGKGVPHLTGVAQVSDPPWAIGR